MLPGVLRDVYRKEGLAANAGRATVKNIRTQSFLKFARRGDLQNVALDLASLSFAVNPRHRRDNFIFLLQFDLEIRH